MPSPSLTIHLFGPLRVWVGASPMPRVPTRSIEWLLALLALRQGRAAERAWLAGTLWPESTERQALNNLRNDLVHLRKALGSERERLQSPTRDTLLLDLDGAEADVILFDQAIEAGEAASLLRAVALYTGPLLEGCYEVWATPERARREQACLSALETLARQAEEQQNHVEAIRYLRRAGALDPLSDSTAQRLMAELAASGDPGAAIQVYREFRKRLLEELAASPQEATTRLFQQIRLSGKEGARAVSAGTRGPILPSDPTQVPDRSSTEGAPAEMERPDLGSASPVPRLLTPPHPLTPLIGREQEIDEITNRLTKCRLLTLIGTGGVGKTRLALEVSARVERMFERGVIWVELGPLTEGALILPTIAAMLGLLKEGRSDPETLRNALISYFSAGAALLILDNCEHLLDAVAEIVQPLLWHCPPLRVLATSRQRIGLAGEIVWRVPSLSTPSSAQPPIDTRTALAFPAIQLFVERASAARSDFYMTRPEELEAVCRISRRLDGIPLALELAAARTNVLSVEQIASRLDDRFRLLTGGGRTLPLRQQTLRALIDWSYDQLPEEERVLLRRMSVFAGGWSLEAAESIGVRPMTTEVPEGDAAPSSPAIPDIVETLDALASLVERSLVVAEASRDGLRYRLLETVREYGREKLQESGEEEAARSQHAVYYLALAEQARPFLAQPELAWLNRLDTEHDNLRAALTFYAAQEATLDQAVRLAAALIPFWSLRSHFYEQQTWLLGLALRPTPPTPARAKLLGETAVGMVIERKDFAGAERMLAERLEIARQWKDQASIADAVNGLAWLMIEAHSAGQSIDLAKPRSLSEESLAIMQELGDHQGMAHSLFQLGRLAWEAANYEEARTRWQECLAQDQALGVKGGMVLRYLGDLALASGDYAEARTYFRTFLAERFEIGERWGMMWALLGLAVVTQAEGEPERAARLLGALTSIGESLVTSLSPKEWVQLYALQNELRERLGAAAYDTEWAKGHAMSLEQIAHYALATNE